MPPFEVLLPLGAIAFYLFDSAALLSSRELVFERLGSRWRVLGGSDFLLLGKRPLLPNPFTPYRPMFLVYWQDEVAAQQGSMGTVESFAKALRPIQWIVSVLLALLFIAVPVAALVYGAGVALLTVFAAFYLLVLLALAIVIRRRRALSLSGKECLGLAAHVLLCAPFAVNMVRRLSWRWQLPDAPLQFVNSSFDESSRRNAIAAFTRRVDQALQTLDPETPRAARLQEFRRKLEGKLEGTT